MDFVVARPFRAIAGHDAIVDETGASETTNARKGPMNVKIGETEMEKKILFSIDEDWLALRHEEPIDPAMPIIDVHHHLWERGGARYLLDDLKRDIDGSGHNIRASGFMQCDSMYRQDGDPKFAPVGETEFVNGIAAMSASGGYGAARLCSGIVGYVDLSLGPEVDVVVEAHLRAGGGRFKGVRYCTVWDADKSIKSTPFDYPKGLLLDEKFRSGFARLARYGLSFDSLIYHPQIPELADIARRAMFESNFPVDKRYYSYGIMWNAFKKLAASYSAAEKTDLFFNTAKRVYRLPTTMA